MKVSINHLLIEREPLEYRIDSLILSDFVMTSNIVGLSTNHSTIGALHVPRVSVCVCLPFKARAFVHLL